MLGLLGAPLGNPLWMVWHPPKGGYLPTSGIRDDAPTYKPMYRQFDAPPRGRKGSLMTPKQMQETLKVAIAAGASPEQLTAIVAGFNGQTTNEPTNEQTTPNEPTTDTPKVYRWKVAICNRHGFPTTKGQTFEYVGKRQTTTHRIIGTEGKGDNRVILTNRV